MSRWEGPVGRRTCGFGTQESIRVRDENLDKLPAKWVKHGKRWEMNTGGSWEPQQVLREGAGQVGQGGGRACTLGNLPCGLVQGNEEEATKAGPSSHGFL